MIGRVIALSARNVILVLLGSAFLAGAGVWALLRTPLDAILDRVIHSAHRLQLRGDSLRKKAAQAIAA